MDGKGFFGTWGQQDGAAPGQGSPGQWGAQEGGPQASQGQEDAQWSGRQEASGWNAPEGAPAAQGMEAGLQADAPRAEPGADAEPVAGGKGRAADGKAQAGDGRKKTAAGQGGRKRKPGPHSGDRNEFTFCGTIVAVRESPRSSMMTLGITTQGGYRSHSNYPRVCGFDDDVREKMARFSERDKVVVTGYVSNNRRDDKDSSRKFPPQTFVATDIQPAKRLLEASLDTEYGGDAGRRSLIPDQNTVCIVGTVDKAYVGRGGNVNLVIATVNEGRYLKLVPVSVFPEGKMNPMEFMVPGTRVALTGVCRTSRKEAPDGTLRYYEGIVASDIAKAREG